MQDRSRAILGSKAANSAQIPQGGNGGGSPATPENPNESKRLAMRIVGSGLSGALLSGECP